ncbi:hypothetical protein, partial [Maribacter algarum]|uniref:beta strand repeat-containing protein n=1 Tax=Maribacter algarum (ex Zhang et al. 2020) TaxID=2578118 RepID=UPI001485D7AC
DDAGTDDQIASEVNITDAGGNFTATEVEGALAELAAGSTDDQNIENLALNGATNELTVGIEDGTSQTVDLSGLVGTDDQDATEVNLNAAVDVDGDGNNETTVQEAIEDLAADSTDDQNIESLGVDTTTNVLTVGIEDGTSQTVDLSHLDDSGTDSQNLSNTVVTANESVEIQISNGTNTTIDIRDADSDITNELSLLGTGAPTVTPSNPGVTYVDQTAGQLYVYNGTAWEAVGGNASPDLDGDPTNERNTAFNVSGGNLNITDSGGTLSVPVASLGTDDQTATEVVYDNTTSGLTATDTQAAIDELSAGSTDDQNIESLGVDTTTNVLTVGIEDGTSQTVDLSHLDDAGTDDQIASEVNITDAGGNFTATEVEGALAELAAGSTDDQNIENLALNGATNELTVGIEDGTSQTVDLSGLVGTDDQDATEVNLNAAVDVDGDGNNETTVQEAIEDLAAGSTDDQNIESLGVDTTTNVLTVGIEDGTSQTVDLSHLDDAGTDDQDATEVNLNAAVDVDGDGNNE